MGGGKNRRNQQNQKNDQKQLQEINKKSPDVTSSQHTPITDVMTPLSSSTSATTSSQYSPPVTNLEKKFPTKPSLPDPDADYNLKDTENLDKDDLIKMINILRNEVSSLNKRVTKLENERVIHDSHIAILTNTSDLLT